MATEEISIGVSLDQALVLYEWLVRTKPAETAQIEDRAEQRVLWDLEAALESQLSEPFRPDYRERLQAARDKVRDADS